MFESIIGTGARYRVIALAPAAILLAQVGAGPARAADNFAAVSVRIEHNISDHDHEVVIEAKSGDAGLARLKVLAPNGRVVAEFNAPDAKLGIRQFVFETPEPKELAALQDDFPAGVYLFTGVTVGGSELAGRAVLDHRLPDAVKFVRPRPDEGNIPIKKFSIRWDAAKGDAYKTIAIEDDATGAKVIEARLADAVASYTVPDGVLKNNTQYKVSVGTIAQGGNASYAEVSFSTAKK